jgi:hypothetical protein
MKMRNSEQTQVPDEKSGTRYILVARYENRTSGDLESNLAAGNMKNLPRTFISMNELDESC